MDEPDNPENMEVEFNEERIAGWFGIIFDNRFWMIFVILIYFEK